MHPEAYEGFGEMLYAAEVDRAALLTVLDLGGQNVNGTVHEWFTHPDTEIVTLDLENADIVADATDWTPDREYDVVISTEVFEHVEHWPRIAATAFQALGTGGVFVATCASTNRPPHGATGDPAPVAGEWYSNVEPAQLQFVLEQLFAHAEVVYKYPPGDAYMWARR
jgi:cyclopropane fatty-acyl-phospholipid synthase-like methyltransferase